MEQKKKKTPDSQKEVFSETETSSFVSDYDYIREDNLYPKLDDIQDDKESDLAKDINWFDF